MKQINAVELKKLLDSKNGAKPLVLDVRESWEFRAGHIPGAKWIPIGQVVQRIDELDSGAPVAVICESGSRSMSVAAFFDKKGFRTVYNVLEGTMGWRMEGYPIEK